MYIYICMEVDTRKACTDSCTFVVLYFLRDSLILSHCTEQSPEQLSAGRSRVISCWPFNKSWSQTEISEALNVQPSSFSSIFAFHFHIMQEMRFSNKNTHCGRILLNCQKWILCHTWPVSLQKYQDACK